MLTLVELIMLAIPAMIVLAIINEPQVLADLFREGVRRRRANDEAADRMQSEIQRKCAIADQAIAARKRGEHFVPPSDYDR